MGKLDPGLRFLAQQNPAELRRLAEQSVFNVEQERDQPATLTVLVQFRGDVSELERAGFTVRRVAGDVATGQIPVDRLDDLAELDSVVRVEASRVLHKELDLAVPEARVPAVHAGAAAGGPVGGEPGHRGAGVVVGIIDSGIDYVHTAFRREDGTSRILAIWDQGLRAEGGESPPSGMDFGVEYRRAAIDEAVKAPDPFAVVRHRDQPIPDAGCHGTHVGGIAAGDGSLAGPVPDDRVMIGAAPEADIVVVANTRGRAAGELGLGDSADSLEAVGYILDLADSLGRPVVINMSQGDNIGPHDGTSLLERGIDNLLGGPGRAMVKSAGNEGAAKHHAGGTLAAGETQVVTFTIPANRASDVVVDLWYTDPDRIDVRLTPPTGAPLAVVSPGAATDPPLVTDAGDRVFVASEVDDPGNHDNRVFVLLSPADESAKLQAGTWSLSLVGTAVTTGRWDAWIQRGEPKAKFQAPFENPSRTISVPGTGHEMITAASYVTRGKTPGSLSSFSSRGPTRDGRPAPTVAAPGQLILSPQPSPFRNAYGLMQGTSMAAPMVTGVVALLLEKNPKLTQAQIRERLEATARTDDVTGATPNVAWGAGKLDAAAAFETTPKP